MHKVSFLNSGITLPTHQPPVLQTMMVLHGDSRTFIVADIVGGPPFEADGAVVLIEWVASEKIVHYRKYSELLAIIDSGALKIIYPKKS